jgi:hypothetical protein
MRRFAVVASAVALVAGGIGAAAAWLVRSPAPSDLHVASRWDWHDRDTRIHVVSGALRSDPRRGFVLFELATRSIDQKTGASLRLESTEPRFFATPDRTGPPAVVAASRWAWVFDSRDGYRTVLELGALDVPPSFYVLGKRLDPERLPTLPAGGIAVPVTYGPRKSKAVLLVGRDPSRGVYQLYGYLPGFAVPPARNPAQRLHRLLLGPGAALYRVDPAVRKLVRAGTRTPEPNRPWRMPPRCSTWAAAKHRWLACVESIVAIAPNGSRSVLLHQDLGAGALARWTFLALSPNRRTLLLEQDVYACGTSRVGYFMPAGGGSLQPVVGDATTQSQPFGWLRDGSALVAAQSAASCEGRPESGIYQAWPGPNGSSSTLLVATSSDDATLWGDAG